MQPPRYEIRSENSNRIRLNAKLVCKWTFQSDECAELEMEFEFKRDMTLKTIPKKMYNIFNYSRYSIVTFSQAFHTRKQKLWPLILRK